MAKCPTFLSWNYSERYQAVKDNTRCFNCLWHSHSMRECTCTFRCRQCGGHHQTLLHRGTPSNDSNSTDSSSATVAPVNLHASTTILTNTESTAMPQIQDTAVLQLSSPSTALLSTAITTVVNGHLQCNARALLDSGASISLMTEKVTTELKLKRHPYRLSISGVTGSQDSVVIQCHVVPKFQSITPPQCPDELFKLPCIADKAPLADPYLGGSIDLLLGIADVGRCTNCATSSSQDGATIATPTIFGWTLGGAIPNENLPSAMLKLQVQDDILIVRYRCSGKWIKYQKQLLVSKIKN